MRKAKIVATIGPSSRSEEKLAGLVQSGMDVARLNFSHGTHAEHKQNFQRIRTVSMRMGKPVTILQDLQGPKLRVGKLLDSGLHLIPSRKAILKDVDCGSFGEDWMDSMVIPVSIPDMEKNLIPGNRVLLDDGKMSLRILATHSGWAETEVMIGGTLLSHKGINLPGMLLKVSILTEKDLEDLKFGLEMGVDAVALSFVQTARDIELLREKIHSLQPEKPAPFIIAKLERPEALLHLDEILAASDGVMVARGDLAVETSPEDVPIMQKTIIKAANRQAKLVITATQMLESMIHAQRPTRAEASDVANAIFDGTDAIMLSGETAVGDYPVESVQMMDAIVCRAEENFIPWGCFVSEDEPPALDDAISTTRAARELAKDREVKLVAVFTVSGRSALLMSKAHPHTAIAALTPHKPTCRRMSLFWGVKPFLSPFSSSVEEMLSHVETLLVENGMVSSGQQIVVVCGYPVGQMSPPNLALLHTISGEGKINTG